MLTNKQFAFDKLTNENLFRIDTGTNRNVDFNFEFELRKTDQNLSKCENCEISDVYTDQFLRYERYLNPLLSLDTIFYDYKVCSKFNNNLYLVLSNTLGRLLDAIKYYKPDAIYVYANAGSLSKVLELYAENEKIDFYHSLPGRFLNGSFLLKNGKKIETSDRTSDLNSYVSEWKEKFAVPDYHKNSKNKLKWMVVKRALKSVLDRKSIFYNNDPYLLAESVFRNKFKIVRSNNFSKIRPKILFPMQVSPEASTFILCPNSKDHLEVINSFINSNSFGKYSLVLRPNRSQYKRLQNNFKFLKNLSPNIVFSDPLEDRIRQLKNVDYIIGFTGTMLLEALHFNKKVFLLCDHLNKLYDINLPILNTCNDFELVKHNHVKVDIEHIFEVENLYTIKHRVDWFSKENTLFMKKIVHLINES